MKNPFLRSIIGLAWIFFPHNLKAQNELPYKIQNYFDTYQKEFPMQKVYLQLDRHTFTLGEDIWFSAFVVAGSDQIPSPLSRTLYVDLFDGDGLLLEQKIVRIEKGRGQGDFQLPSFGKSGSYRIKAYTAWMRNFGEVYFFNQKITVVDGEGGSFLPTIDFKKISSDGSKTTYSVEILALDSKGNPLAGRSFQLKAMGGEEELYSQTFNLNSKGVISFSFSIPEKAYSTQYLELIYAENDSYSLTQKIRLPYSLNLADIQFLPEGGQLVTGKNSKVAFRGIYPDGMPVHIKGNLVGNPEIGFESNFGGLGKFDLTPESRHYQAKVSEESTGQERIISLPKSLDNGLVLQVVNNPVASYVTAFIQGTFELNSLLLVSQTRGIVNYMIQGSLTNGVWGVRIPKENLISGVNQITVLSSEGKPLLERLIYVQKEEGLKLDIIKTGEILPREKLSIELKNRLNGRPAMGSFSVSVVDAGQVVDQSLEVGDISSHLLMTSDLKGTIYQPGYYFKDGDPKTLEDLDLVMLTHGWRRFDWDQVLTAQFPKIDHFIERGIKIEGKVTDKEATRKGLSGGKITALVGEGLEIISSEYGPNGRFIFRDLDYLDSAQVTITAEDIRLKSFINIAIDTPKLVFSTISGHYELQVPWPSALVNTYKERDLMQRLNEGQELINLDGVTVQAKSLEQEEDQIKKIYGAGDVTLNPDKIPGSVAFTNVFQMIQGRVSGVQVFVSGQGVKVTIRGVGSISSSTEPLYLLDNIPVDAGTIFQVSPRDVSSVDVFKDPAKTAIFGAQGANGVIAVYTKTGSGISVSVGGTLVTRYGGFSSGKSFYEPKYDTKPAAIGKADKRATIYWNPMLTIDSSGNVSFSYFNTDLSKRHLLIVEGMDDEGRLGRLVRVLE